MGLIDKKSFIAELEKLLGFMSPWDRQAVIRRYEKRIEEAEDPEQLLEMFGTATKVAVMLADGYVSSPPPETGAMETFRREEEAPEEQLTFDTLADSGGESAAEIRSGQEKQGAGAGVLALYWVLAVVIGLPVAAVLFCVGVPFPAVGVSVVENAAVTVIRTVGNFKLISDTLLLGGGGLILGALGLLIAWLGLWISISLVRLWVGKVILPLARRLRYGKEARAR